MNDQKLLDLAAKAAFRIEELEYELLVSNSKVRRLHDILSTYVDNVCEVGGDEHQLLMSTLDEVMQLTVCSGNLH